MLRPLVILLTIFFFGCSSRQIVEEIEIPRDAATVERGRVLVKGLAACGFCHGENAAPDSVLIGGRSFFDALGEVAVPNITPAKSGIGGWRLGDVVRALRVAKAPGDRDFSTFAHRGYEWLSDRDLFAIAAYLKSIAPVEHTVERRELSFIQQSKSIFLERTPRDMGFIPAISPRHEREYGAYLVENVARCVLCHNSPETLFGNSEYLLGGATIQTSAGSKIAPSITGSENYGIGSWSEQSLVRYLKSGETPSGSVVDPAFCPVGFFANAHENDLIAIAKFIKSFGKDS